MGHARTLAAGQECRVISYEMSTGLQKILHTSSTVLFEAPNWTPSGDLIVNGDGLLWNLPADGSAPPRQIPLPDVPELNNDHVVYGDDVFLSANDGHLYRAPLTGGAATKITSASQWMHFLHGISPDGTTLAYVGLTPGAWSSGTLWTIGADGTGNTPLTTGPGPDDGPEYSPDGDWIYFNTERFSPNAQIARIHPDGTGLEQLTTDDRVNWFPHLPPAGDAVVYLSYPPGTRGHPADLTVELRLVTRGDWRHPRTLVTLPGGQGTINVNSWSPDGARFAYVDYPQS